MVFIYYLKRVTPLVLDGWVGFLLDKHFKKIIFNTMKYNLKNKLLSQLKNSKSLKNQVEILGYFYVENYNYRLKNIIIQEAIKELELPIIFTKKGIKKRLKN